MSSGKCTVHKRYFFLYLTTCPVESPGTSPQKASFVVHVFIFNETCECRNRADAPVCCKTARLWWDCSLTLSLCGLSSCNHIGHGKDLACLPRSPPPPQILPTPHPPHLIWIPYMTCMLFSALMFTNGLKAKSTTNPCHKNKLRLF